jgi:hypothetical protein
MLKYFYILLLFSGMLFSSYSFNETGNISFSFSGVINDIEATGNWIYISTSSSFYVFNVSDKTNPSFLTNYSFSNLVDFKAVGNYGYGVSTNSFYIFEISDRNSITILDTYVNSSLIGTPGEFDIDGNYVYLTSISNDNFIILNISNPSSINYVSSLSGTDFDGASSIQIENNLAFVNGREYIPFVTYNGFITIVNISNVISPVTISKTQYSTVSSESNFVLFEDELYIFTIPALCASFCSAFIYSYDISNLTSPTLSYTYSSRTYDPYLKLLNNTLFTLYEPSSLDSRIELLDVSNSSNISSINTYSVPVISNFFLFDQYLYGVSTSDLTIYNLTSFAPAESSLESASFPISNSLVSSNVFPIVGSLSFFFLFLGMFIFFIF